MTEKGLSYFIHLPDILGPIPFKDKMDTAKHGGLEKSKVSQVRGIYGPFLLFSLFLGGKFGTYLEICIAYLATLVLLSGDLQQPVPAVERVLPPGGLPPRQENHIPDKGPGKLIF